MKNVMNKILSPVLSLSLVFAPVLSKAEQTTGGQVPYPSVTKAEDFERKFKNVVYSIQTIPGIVEDLKRSDSAAGGAISKSVAAEINARMSAAIELSAVIMHDRSLPKEKQTEMIIELGSSIGEVFFTTLRHQGEDKIEIAEKVTTLEQAKAVAREFLLDGKALVSFQRPADPDRI